MIVTELKICTKCKTPKPYSEFHKKRTRPDGHFEWCKSCNNGNRQKVYLTKEKGQETYYQRKRRQLEESRLRHPDRAKARSLATRFKDRIKKDKCENCGSTDRLHMHHPDYSRPLDVVTLCRPCHDTIPKSNVGDKNE